MQDIVNPFTVLLVFYLYCMVRWERVKRPLLFLLGAAGITFALIGLFFTLGDNRGVRTVANIFMIIGQLVAFVGAVGACFGGELPVKFSAQGGGQPQNQPPQE